MILSLPIRAHCVFGALGRQGEEDPEAFETGSLPVSPDLLPVFLSGKFTHKWPGSLPEPLLCPQPGHRASGPLQLGSHTVLHFSASLGHTKSFCWLSLLPVWCVCLLLSQSQPVVGQTLLPPGGPMGATRCIKPPLFLLPAPCSAHHPSHGALARCFRLCQRLT